jgi:hypothetical protein
LGGRARRRCRIANAEEDIDPRRARRRHAGEGAGRRGDGGLRAGSGGGEKAAASRSPAPIARRRPPSRRLVAVESQSCSADVIRAFLPQSRAPVEPGKHPNQCIRAAMMPAMQLEDNPNSSS